MDPKQRCVVGHKTLFAVIRMWPSVPEFGSHVSTSLRGEHVVLSYSITLGLRYLVQSISS
jgi:hypothetical protein